MLQAVVDVAVVVAVVVVLVLVVLVVGVGHPAGNKQNKKAHQRKFEEAAVLF